MRVSDVLDLKPAPGDCRGWRSNDMDDGGNGHKEEAGSHGFGGCCYLALDQLMGFVKFKMRLAMVVLMGKEDDIIYIGLSLVAVGGKNQLHIFT